MAGRGNRAAYRGTDVGSSFGVGLLAGLGAIECLELHALLEYAHRRGIRSKLAVIALRVENLWHETAIGHGRRLAARESGARIQFRLQFPETVGDPMPIPGVHLVLVLSERTLQMLQHPQVVERMDLARDELRERAHARLSHRFRRKERRARMLFLEILHDGERLVEPRSVIELERG